MRTKEEVNAKQRARRAANPEKYRALAKKRRGKAYWDRQKITYALWAKAHPERVSELRTFHNRKRAEYHREYGKRYNAKNRERLRAQERERCHRHHERARREMVLITRGDYVYFLRLVGWGAQDVEKQESCPVVLVSLDDLDFDL